MSHLFALQVLSASNLPKMDRFGKIDAYVKLFCDGTLVGKTKTVEKNFNPLFGDTLSFVGSQSSKLRMVVFDQDVGSADDEVGVAEIPSHAIIESLTSFGAIHDVDITITAKKKKAKSSIKFMLSALKTYQTVSSEIRAANVPGVVPNDSKQTLCIPFRDFANFPVYLALEFEIDGVDVKLLCTQPGDGLYLDMAMAGRQVSSIRRRSFLPQKPLMVHGLSVFQEIKMDDLPLSTDFSQLTLIAFKTNRVQTVSLDKVVSSCGWKGALNYAGAKAKLHGVEWDDSEEEIYMPLPNCDYAKLVVDWDGSDVDIKCLMLEHPGAATNTCDLSIEKSGSHEVKKKSRIFNPIKLSNKGKYRVTRYLELDDVPFGTLFKEMVWYNYALLENCTVRLTDLVSLR